MVRQIKQPKSKLHTPLSIITNSNFWKYWKAGITFLIVSSFITWIIFKLVLDEIIDDNLKTLLPSWTYSAIKFIIFIAILIAIPWAYGKLTKWVYEKFEFGKKE